MVKDSLLWRWLWVENICFAAVPRADCWSLWKSGIKSIYLHVLLFIYFELGETEKKTSTHRAWILSILCAGEKILCCTDVRWLLGNTHLEQNVQQMLLQRFACASHQNSGTVYELPPHLSTSSRNAENFPESLFPTFLFTSVHFFRPGLPFNA